MINIITGDLLQATEKYLCHQTNCLSNGGAAGIARLIFDRYPYADCYSDRTAPSQPGTIDVRGDDTHRRIINIHSQYYPGSPIESDLDDSIARQKYFYQGLTKIAKISNLESIAFNYRIGCGIAGGNWETYQKMLNTFEAFVAKQGVKVSIYRREGDQ